MAKKINELPLALGSRAGGRSSRAVQAVKQHLDHLCASGQDRLTAGDGLCHDLLEGLEEGAPQGAGTGGESRPGRDRLPVGGGPRANCATTYSSAWGQPGLDLSGGLPGPRSGDSMVAPAARIV